jgi:hypothetical protein
MSKARISLALLVLAMSGGLAVKLIGKAVSADSSVNKVTGAVVKTDAVMVDNPTTVQTGGQEGICDLNPINMSGIRALIHVQKIGQTETITGFATGMDPNKVYVSLFYDVGSPGSGPCACIPSNQLPEALQSTCKTTNAPAVNFSQMMIGYWLPLVGSSKRTLQVLKAGAPNAPAPLAFAPLENIGSVSIREDMQPGQSLPNEPDPARFQLRACGKFRLDNAQVASR